MGSQGAYPLFLRLWRWLPALAWMALIFGASGDALSAPHTSRWVEPLLRWLLGGGASPAVIEWVHFLLRKAGHVGEYAVLAILLRRAFRPAQSAGTPPPENDPPSWHGRADWFAVGLAAAFAVSDELHQAFVPTRGASAADVCLDTVGAALGILGLGTLQRVRRRS